MIKKQVASAGVSAGLVGVAGVLGFGLRGYEVVALLLVGVAVLVLLWAFVGGVAFKAAAVLAGVLALAVALTEIPIVSNARTDAGDDADFLIVLGARVNEGGNPSRTLLWRLEATLDYLEAHPGAKAVLSGGQGADEPTSEAACMRDWLLARGVAESRLIVEDESTSTYENLRNSFALIDGYEADGDASAVTDSTTRPVPRIAVVSSSYHLYRAKLIARSLGVEVCGVAGFPGNPVVALNYFVREAPAVWKQMLIGAY